MMLDMYVSTLVRTRLQVVPQLLRQESGQGMVEYAFILVLISLVIIITLILVGNQVFNMWSDISNGIRQAAP